MKNKQENIAVSDLSLLAKEGGKRYLFCSSASDFKKIPGSPIAYWASSQTLDLFKGSSSLSERIETREGLTTGNNDLFLRFWHEVSIQNINFNIKNIDGVKNIGKPWFPYVKGGNFRRWSGNFEHIVNWLNDGEELRNFKDIETGRVRSHNYNGDYSFRTGITWSGISSGAFAVRHVPSGFMFDAKGPMGFSIVVDEQKNYEGFLNSTVTNHFIKMLAPTLDFKLGHILNLPLKTPLTSCVKTTVNRAIEISLMDWNDCETSWDFTKLPLLQSDYRQPSLKDTYTKLRSHWKEVTLKMQNLEEENNQIFIEAYELQDELTPEVPLPEITLTCNPHYRYGKGKTEEEYETYLLTDTIKELISYSIGCMMGRYSLDYPGLIYAHSSNIDFNPSKYKILPADDDGIIPVMDMDWFADDAAKRFVEFIKTAWPSENLDENLKFIADTLNPKASESSEDTIRRYLSTTFFKDHMKTYKKRPIYWLFSSGKQKAFECLVYLHRYNDATLSRMRSHYVTPLQGNIRAQIEFLEHEKDESTTASSQKKIQKEIDILKKKQLELKSFDDELRHYADMKISIDLDDGVKVNYGKFGNLLAETKAITG